MLEGEEKASIKGFLGSKIRESGKGAKIKSIETFNRDNLAEQARKVVKPSPATRKKIGRGIRKAARAYGDFADNYTDAFEEFPGFQVGYGESGKGKKARVDPTGSGLDMDAYLNSWVPSTGPAPKGKKVKKSDVYDPFAGLNFGGYLEGAAATGKSKRRSKDPIGQFFY